MIWHAILLPLECVLLSFSKNVFVVFEITFSTVLWCIMNNLFFVLQVLYQVIAQSLNCLNVCPCLG